MCNTSANFKSIIILDYDCQKDNEKFCMPMLISCKDKILYGKFFSKLCKKNRFKKHLLALFPRKSFHVCIINK